MSKNIYVTRPYLPPLTEFQTYLEQIWDNGILTNNGPIHQQLEAALAGALEVDHLSLFNNGTVALVTALQALGLEPGAEVITTPFSFVATSHALMWNGLTPVFADIEPTNLNLDPTRIEAAITPRTQAILPVHCYGNPCDTAALQAIADRHGLKVIYDAAHAFGVRDAGGSVLRHGDFSVLSFHATKVFNTLEGGAIISPDAETKHRIDRLKNFGIVSETEVECVGINGKMNEVQAAFGLLQLNNIDAALAARGRVAARYRAALQDVAGITAVPLAGQNVANHAYFPILVDPAYPLDRDGLYDALRRENIYARRYFFPLIANLPMYADYPSAVPANLPQANRLADQVLCLPIYPDLGEDDVERILDVVRGAQ